MGRHVIEALGKTRVVIQDGKVVEVGEPLVHFCPLFYKHRGIEEISANIVRKNVEFRIKDFGMCTAQRKMRMRDFLSFGVSELMGMCLSNGLLDCVVIVCEGTGTVIVDDPELAQGIGGRISGILETDPIPELIKTVGEDRVLDANKAIIDQLAGVRKAAAMGYRRIGVSVALASDAERIRHELGASAVIFAVHTTRTSEEEARSFFDHCDIISACASRAIWEEAQKRDVLKVGNKVPIFAVTDVGKNILKLRMEQIKYSSPDGPDTPPRPLI